MTPATATALPILALSFEDDDQDHVKIIPHVNPDLRDALTGLGAEQTDERTFTVTLPGDQLTAEHCQTIADIVSLFPAGSVMTDESVRIATDDSRLSVRGRRATYATYSELYFAINAAGFIPLTTNGLGMALGPVRHAAGFSPRAANGAIALLDFTPTRGGLRMILRICTVRTPRRDGLYLIPGRAANLDVFTGQDVLAGPVTDRGTAAEILNAAEQAGWTVTDHAGLV